MMYHSLPVPAIDCLTQISTGYRCFLDSWYLPCSLSLAIPPFMISPVHNLSQRLRMPSLPSNISSGPKRSTNGMQNSIVSIFFCNRLFSFKDHCPCRADEPEIPECFKIRTKRNETESDGYLCSGRALRWKKAAEYYSKETGDRRRTVWMILASNSFPKRYLAPTIHILVPSIWCAVMWCDELSWYTSRIGI